MVYVPTRDEIADMLLTLLPPGRAFQRFGSYVPKEDSTLKKVLYAIAGVWHDMELVLAQAIDEFSAATASATLDRWYEDYALPDECDPFAANLAAKVAARGGSTTGYYHDLATQLGWITSMRWLTGSDRDYPGVRSTLYAGISTLSPAIASFQFARVELGQVDVMRFGEPDTTLLICALDRLIPAHAEIIYEFI
jgi:uncharacterized protein YmfQ (DUF2313 family)